MTTRTGGAGRGRLGRGRSVTGISKTEGGTRGRKFSTKNSPETIMQRADPVTQVTVKQKLINEVESKAKSVSVKPKWVSEKGRQCNLLGYGFNKGESVEEPVVVDGDEMVEDDDDIKSKASDGNKDAATWGNEKERGNNEKEEKNEKETQNFDEEGSWDENNSPGYEDSGTEYAPDADGDRGEENQKKEEEKRTKRKKNRWEKRREC